MKIRVKRVPSYENGGDVDKSKAKKVDKVPDGYAPAGEEGGKKYFVKNDSITMEMAAKAKVKGGEEYEMFLQQKLASGVTPEELVNKGYISSGNANLYAKYYKPIQDFVYTEQSLQGPPTLTDEGIVAGMQQMMYDGNKHGVGIYSFLSRKTDTKTKAGNTNTGYVGVRYEPVDKMGKKTGSVYNIPPEVWNNLTTSRTMPDVSQLAQYQQAQASYKKGGKVPKYEGGGFGDPNGKPYPKTFKKFKYKNKLYEAPQSTTPEDFYSNPWVIEQLKADQTFPKAWDDAVWGPEHQRIYDEGLRNGKIPSNELPPVTVTGRRNTKIDIGVFGSPEEIAPPEQTRENNFDFPAPTLGKEYDWEKRPVDPFTIEEEQQNKDRVDNRFSDMDNLSILSSLLRPIKRYNPIREQVRFTPNKWYDQDLSAQRQMIKGQVAQSQRASAMLGAPQAVQASLASGLQGAGLDALNQSYMTEFETNRQGRMGTEIANNAGFDAAYNQNQQLTGAYHDQMTALNQNTDEAKAAKRQDNLLTLQNAVRNRDTRKLISKLFPNYPVDRNFDVGFVANPNIMSLLTSRGSGGADRLISYQEFSQFPDVKKLIDMGKEDEAIKLYRSENRGYQRRTGDFDRDGVKDYVPGF